MNGRRLVFRPRRDLGGTDLGGTDGTDLGGTDGVTPNANARNYKSTNPTGRQPLLPLGPPSGRQ
jgi:hypothetical protein